MCMAEGGEMAHVWHESRQRARKPYKCDACGSAGDDISVPYFPSVEGAKQ
jgi:hypothetical protein